MKKKKTPKRRPTPAKGRDQAHKKKIKLTPAVVLGAAVTTGMIGGGLGSSLYSGGVEGLYVAALGVGFGALMFFFLAR